MRELAKLRALDPAERRVLAAAVVALPLIAAAVAFAGYRRVHAALSRWPRVVPARSDGEAARSDRARRVARAVAIAGGHGLLRASCLRRALLTWWLLRREGIEAVIRVGVARTRDALDAHAWVEYLGRPLVDADDVASRFSPFERDFGTPSEPVS